MASQYDPRLPSNQTQQSQQVSQLYNLQLQQQLPLPYYQPQVPQQHTTQTHNQHNELSPPPCYQQQIPQYTTQNYNRSPEFSRPPPHSGLLPLPASGRSATTNYSQPRGHSNRHRSQCNPQHPPYVQYPPYNHDVVAPGGLVWNGGVKENVYCYERREVPHPGVSYNHTAPAKYPQHNGNVVGFGGGLVGNGQQNAVNLSNPGATYNQTTPVKANPTSLNVASPNGAPIASSTDSHALQVNNPATVADDRTEEVYVRSIVTDIRNTVDDAVVRGDGEKICNLLRGVRSRFIAKVLASYVGDNATPPPLYEQQITSIILQASVLLHASRMAPASSASDLHPTAAPSSTSAGPHDDQLDPTKIDHEEPYVHPSVIRDIRITIDEAVKRCEAERISNVLRGVRGFIVTKVLATYVGGSAPTLRPGKEQQITSILVHSYSILLDSFQRNRQATIPSLVELNTSTATTTTTSTTQPEGAQQF